MITENLGKKLALVTTKQGHVVLTTEKKLREVVPERSERGRRRGLEDACFYMAIGAYTAVFLALAVMVFR